MESILLSETLGTMMLTLLGCGVVANVSLAKNKGFDGGFLMVNIGWGFAVMTGIIVAVGSGAHINPAVTVGLLASGDGLGGVGNVAQYFAGEFLGAFIGAVLCWAAYKDHFDDAETATAAKLGTFATGPAIRKTASNLITEIVGTFVLVFTILALGLTGNGGASDVAFILVPFLVIGIGASLGGPTGYAINPARDLGPRVAHAVLPIKGKGSSDWGYSWIPVAGPLIGGVLAGLAGGAVI